MLSSADQVARASRCEDLKRFTAGCSSSGVRVGSIGRLHSGPLASCRAVDTVAVWFSDDGDAPDGAFADVVGQAGRRSRRPWPDRDRRRFVVGVERRPCSLATISLIATVLLGGRSDLTGQQRLALAPTSLEAFAMQPDARTTWSKFIGRLEGGTASAIISAVAWERAGATPRTMRGIRIELRHEGLRPSCDLRYVEWAVMCDREQAVAYVEEDRLEDLRAGALNGPRRGARRSSNGRHLVSEQRGGLGPYPPWLYPSGSSPRRVCGDGLHRGGRAEGCPSLTATMLRTLWSARRAPLAGWKVRGPVRRCELVPCDPETL